MGNTVELTLLANDKATSTINGVSGAVRSLIGQFMAMAGLTAGVAGLGALVKQGIDFNKTMEDSKGGIAGVLLMTRQYVDAAGKVVTGQGAMNAAFAEASTIQEKLKKDALGTAASYTELVGAFQTALAPAAAAGVTKLDDVREITVMATQAMAALNIPTAQAAQELRGLFAGDAGPDNRLNQILRVTKADLERVRGSADEAAKLFKDRLGPAASAAAMQTGTLTVRLSSLGDIVDQTMGKATEGLFKDLSGLVADVSSGVGEAAGAFTDMGTTVQEAFAVVKETISDVVGVVRQDLSNAGVTGREVLQALAILFVGFVESVGNGMKAVAQYVTAPVETLWGVWKTLIFGIASLFSELLLKLADTPVIGKFFKGWSMGIDSLVVSMTTVDERFANFERKADSSFGSGGAFEHAKKMIESFAGSAREAGATLDGLGSKAKKSAEEVQAAARAMAAKFKAEAVPVFSGFWSDYLLKPLKIGWASAELIVGKSTDRMLATVSEWREKLRREIDGLFEYSSDSAEAGVKAGWLSVLASIPTAAESAAQAVQGVWGSMARAFDDLFFNVLSGRLDSLGDVFRGFADNLRGIFSNLVTGMVERWLSGQQTIAEGWKNLNQSMLNESGGLSVQGGLMAAGTGYGIGSMVGQGTQANQVGAAAGAVVGAIIGSVIPVIGTILGTVIGAVLGGLIGELFNKNTEKHLTGSLGAMAGATSWRFIDPWTEQRRGQDPIEHPGWWEGTKQSPTTAFERQGQIALDSQAAAFYDLFRAGAKDQAKGLLQSYQKALKEGLSGANFDIAAGSAEDIEKDAKYLLSTLLPRIGLSAAFGQMGYLPTGYKDKPGGIPGINWGMPGMNPDGTWQEKKLFDKDAAIPKFLLGLKFTEEKVAELAGRISTDDPAKLLAYITGIVGVVVGLRDLGSEMGKTFEVLVKGWKDESAGGPAAAFGKAAQDLAGQFDELSLYSGDEQLKKAQEAQAEALKFWDSVKSYLQQLQALSEKLSAGLQGMREKMRAFLNPLSEAAGMASDWGIVDATWGKLQNATDAGQVESATNEAAAAIERLFNVLSERVTRGKALLERVEGLIGKLGSLRTDLAFAELERSNPLKAWGQQMVDMQEKIANASRLSGLEQIAALEDVGTSAETMYQNLKGFLTDIANVSASINKSIDTQIWELGVGEMDPRGQASAITDRIKQLQDELKAATSPAEIAAITSEIQSLTGRYVGQFDKNDPERADAIAWAQEQLERARGLANEALEALKKQAEDFAKGLETILSGSVTTISGNVDQASTVIGQLSFTLNELDKAMQDAIKRLGQDALDSLEPLREAMEGAAGIFTGATGATSTALTAPETGLNASVDRSAARLDVFTGAVDRAIANLDRLANARGGGSAPSTANVVQGAPESRATTSQIVSTVRRFSRSLTPRVA